MVGVCKKRTQRYKVYEQWRQSWVRKTFGCTTLYRDPFAPATSGTAVALTSCAPTCDVELVFWRDSMAFLRSTAANHAGTSGLCVPHLNVT